MAQHVYPLPDVDPPDDADEGDAASGDAGLVARARQGDRAAFALLFDRHAPRVYALAYRIAGQEVEAEDITQEAFLRALHALPTLRHGATFGPWVARIATNRCAGREVHPRMIRLIGSAFTLTKAIHTMSMSIMHDIGATITSVVGKARRERAYAW